MRWTFFFFLAPTAVAWTHYAQKAPIVFAMECDRLKARLNEVACGKRFLLLTDFSTGNTTEDGQATRIRSNLQKLMRLSLLLTHALARPVVQVDTTHTQHLPYNETVQALNMARAFLQGGVGDLACCDEWGTLDKPVRQSVRFAEALGAKARMDDYFVGHAARIAAYERQMTRNDSVSGKLYACSSHFLWQDENNNTTVPLPLVENPLGVVATDATSATDLPSTIIVRMEDAKKNLPPLIDKVGDRHVVWCCDPAGSARRLHDFLGVMADKKKVVGGLFVRERDADLMIRHAAGMLGGPSGRRRTPSSYWRG